MITIPFEPAEVLDTPDAVAVARGSVAINRDLAALFARLDADGPGNGRTLGEIEVEMYGPFGEPI